MNEGKKVRVACVLWGTLQHRGRLLKQISELRNAGAYCKLYYGDRGELPLRAGDYDFPIDVIPASWNCHPAALFFRQLKFCKIAATRILSENYTHVLCFSLTTLLAGVWAKRQRNDLVLVYDSNELHIEAMVNPLKRMVWTRIQNYCVPYCDVILHAEEQRLLYFQKHHDPCPSARTHFTLANLPKFLHRESIAWQECDNPVRVLYVGVLGPDRFTEELINIFAELGEHYALDLVGPTSNEYRSVLNQVLANCQARNIKLKPPIPHEEMSSLIRKYQIGIVLYRNDNLCNYYCAPNKLYDYLMNGVPVITNDYPGLLQVVDGNDVGVCVKNVDTKSFRSAIQSIHAGRKARNITESLRRKYSWESQRDAYLSIFKLAR